MNLENLRARAQLLHKLRHYFADAQVLEADVPALAAYSVTDVNLRALATCWQGKTLYLQTSPEFYLKRLLANGFGDIYYLGKAYRNDDSAARHQPEFTMLEWYRLGFDDNQLIADVKSLLKYVGVDEPLQVCNYRDIFFSKTGLDPHLACDKSLQQYCQKRYDLNWDDAPRSTWLELIFSFDIEPTFQSPTIVKDFPLCQAALAKVANDELGEPVAKRFELYWQGLEIANGYWELTDAKEQKRRFIEDNHARREQGLPEIKPDPDFLAAIEKGLPECAGIALGVDRLLMCLLGKTHIREVLAFTH